MTPRLNTLEARAIHFERPWKAMIGEKKQEKVPKTPEEPELMKVKRKLRRIVRYKLSSRLSVARSPVKKCQSATSSNEGTRAVEVETKVSEKPSKTKRGSVQCSADQPVCIFGADNHHYTACTKEQKKNCNLWKL